MDADFKTAYSMLPKSSKRVAVVIKLANQLAREDEQEYVGTEHMLLAILHEGTGIGSTLLVGRGVTAEGLRKEIDGLIRKQMEETWVFGRLPGTPHFKNVMASAISEAQDEGAREVCTEHILLALARERGCVAQKSLENLGIKHDDLRHDLSAIRAGIDS